MLSAAAGSATAEGVDVASIGHNRVPTAWAFIQSRPELRNIALILEYAGYKETLSSSFRGTLLLPTNDVSASTAAAAVDDHSSDDTATATATAASMPAQAPAPRTSHQLLCCTRYATAAEEHRLCIQF
jgi:hypothetical protein